MNSANFPCSRALSPRMAPGRAMQLVAAALKVSTRSGVVVGMLLSAGCASIDRTPQPAASPQAARPATTDSIEPKVVAQVLPSQAPAVDRASMADNATQPGVVPSVPAIQGAAQAAATPAKAPAKPTATPSASVPPAKSGTPAAAPSKPQAAAPLDLKSLETRLKETRAIGVFTKLALKNQIDELLEQFRGFYQGKFKTSLADLRRSYDMLVLKVLALLQDADAPLAGAVAGSREAIWGILSDPKKFAAL